MQWLIRFHLKKISLVTRISSRRLYFYVVSLPACARVNMLMYVVNRRYGNVYCFHSIHDDLNCLLWMQWPACTAETRVVGWGWAHIWCMWPFVPSMYWAFQVTLIWFTCACLYDIHKMWQCWYWYVMMSIFLFWLIVVDCIWSVLSDISNFSIR